jgi:hypothetical protein
VYGFSILGEHTVAGVEIERLYDGGEIQREVANQADQMAVRAKAVAAQAQNLAVEAAELAAHAREAANRAGGPQRALDAEVGSAAVDPQATARELLKVRTALVSRIT